MSSDDIEIIKLDTLQEQDGGSKTKKDSGKIVTPAIDSDESESDVEFDTDTDLEESETESEIESEPEKDEKKKSSSEREESETDSDKQSHKDDDTSSSETSDDDSSQCSTTELLAADPLYFVLSRFMMTKDGKNIADVLDEINHSLRKISKKLHKK